MKLHKITAGLYTYRGVEICRTRRDKWEYALAPGMTGVSRTLAEAVADIECECCLLVAYHLAY